nr:uncharacterized protein LOC121131176 [Lepeophtheirus salmonis]
MELGSMQKKELYSSVIEERSDIARKMLARYPTPQSEKEFCPEPRHVVQHEIFTTGNPCFSRTHRLTSEKETIVRKEDSKLLSPGIIHRSKSNWSSPIHLVPKQDGSWRMVGDYR